MANPWDDAYSQYDKRLREGDMDADFLRGKICLSGRTLSRPSQAYSQSPTPAPSISPSNGGQTAQMCFLRTIQRTSPRLAQQFRRLF